MLDEQRIIHGEHTARTNAAQKLLLIADQAGYQLQGLLVQLLHLPDARGGEERLFMAAKAPELLFPGGQFPVDPRAGELLGLALGQIREFREYFP